MRERRMSKKQDERHIGEVFIKEYNLRNATSYIIDDNYMENRDEKEFPDLKFTMNSSVLDAEVVRAVNQTFEKMKSHFDDLELIEVDAHKEISVVIEKKDGKHYYGAHDVILLVNVESYAERDELKPMCSAIQRKGYNFREIWAVWSDNSKSPLKLS